MIEKIADPETVRLAIDTLICPKCSPEVKFQTASGIRGHLNKRHNIVVRAINGQPVRIIQTGETVVLGRKPDDVLRITFEQGATRRSIETWILTMADAFDAVAGALRQQIERPVKR